MFMRHIRVRQLSTKLSIIELKRRGLCYVFCEIGSKRGFIIGKAGIITNLMNQKNITVSVIEEKKYKPVDQYMRMQIGKMGTTYTGISTYNCRIIGDTSSGQPFFVWEIL